MSGVVRIGTRGSPLAVAQAKWVASRIETARPGMKAELLCIKTSGDRFTDRPLREVGGKGLFVKEIEEALLAGHIDCAVHSLKDLPASLPDGLLITAVPTRVTSADVLVTREGWRLEQLPRGVRIGTSSLRRTALLQWLRPDLECVPLRGNLDTRLRKLEAGELEAVVVAEAGLLRLGVNLGKTCALDPVIFLPAVGQGALAVETRTDHWAAVLRFLHDETTGHEITAERAFLAALGGSCHTPIAARAYAVGGVLTLHGLVADPAGRQVIRGRRSGSIDLAKQIGESVAEQVLANGGARLLHLESAASGA